jgi:DNA (cytosine-5)-methyltransferase 1
MGPIAVDLFCGCGGISAGLRQAGFEVLAGVDIEPTYICTFEKNFLSSKALQIDLTCTDPNDFMQSIGIKPGQLDLLAGGPPCQGFSKNVPRKSRFLEDPRNMLVSRFLDYCKSLKPKMILMENVAEMKNGFESAYSDEVVDRLERYGYTVSHAVLNSADFGVPQKRRRAFFIANRFDKAFSFPDVTHVASESNLSLFPKPLLVTVWDAIGDLPSRKHGEGITPDKYYSDPSTDYQVEMRNGSKTLLNHIARKLQPVQFERLAALKPGQGLKDLPEHLKVNGGYSGAYGRLTKDMLAPTITRWVFHPGSGRWGHPIDIRTLTMREAARIQSFHDDYEFIGSYNQQAGQIGNAVPPRLAQRISESMLTQLNK